MTHPLSRIPLLGKLVDERFLEHRRRSSSVAGIVTAVLTLCLFEYRFFANHVWDWNLLGLGVAFVVIKMSMFTWYRLND